MEREKNAVSVFVPVILVVLFCAVLFLFAGNGRSNVEGEQENYSEKFFAMDTVMVLTVYGEHAEEAVTMAKEEIKRLEGILSAKNAQSEVSRLNETGDAILSSDTKTLLIQALDIYNETSGNFDITILPLMKLWDFTGENPKVPTREELDSLLPLVGSDKIQRIPDRLQDTDPQAMGTESTESVRMTLPEGVQIDLGGIAKGYTGACLVEKLRQLGVESAMLNLGGNVQLLGEKPDGSQFKIAIKHPDDNQDRLGVLQVSDVAVVTSGGYERYFEQDGRVYHHILNPATGEPAFSGLKSVTVVSPNGTLADGYSTALFVMGTEKAIHFWQESDKEFEMILYTEEGQIFATSGLKDCFSSDDPISWVMRK